MLGERSPGNRGQPERSRVGAAARWRPRGRRVAAPAIAGVEPADARRRSREHRLDPARPGAGRGGEGRLRVRRIAAFASRWRSARKALGERHPIVAMTLNTLSRVLREQRRVRRGGGRAAGGAEHRQARRSAASINWWRSTRSISERYSCARNEPAAAEALLREGLRIRRLAPTIVPLRRRTFLEDDWSIAATESLLAKASTH